MCRNNQPFKSPIWERNWQPTIYNAGWPASLALETLHHQADLVPGSRGSSSAVYLRLFYRTSWPQSTSLRSLISSGRQVFLTWLLDAICLEARKLHVSEVLDENDITQRREYTNIYILRYCMIVFLWINPGYFTLHNQPSGVYLSTWKPNKQFSYPA